MLHIGLRNRRSLAATPEYIGAAALATHATASTEGAHGAQIEGGAEVGGSEFD